MSSPRKSGSETSSDSFELNRESAIQKKTKFVVRKIPLFTTEEEIKGYLQEFNIQNYDWFYFCSQPKLPNPTRRNKQRWNRFYVNFKSFQDAIPFIEKFKKLEIKQKPSTKDKDKDKDKPENTKMDTKTYKLMVEFAPNQQIPTIITSKDRRNNTIEKDADFLNFVQGLKDRKKQCEATRKQVEEDSIRRNVIDTFGRNKSKKEISPEPQPKASIAPLAQHVASQRYKRQFLIKKIDRASLVKSERAKERRLERVREARRRKRIALAKASKYGRKYGANSSKQWVAKTTGNDKKSQRNKESVDRYYDKKRSKYNDRFEYDYDDEYDYRYESSSRQSYKSSTKGSSYRDRGYSAKRRGSSRRKARSKRSNAEYSAERSTDSQPHFSGYSRRKGHQTWQKAK